MSIECDDLQNPARTAFLQHHVHLTKEEIDEDRTAFAARTGACFTGCLLPLTDRVENPLRDGGTKTGMVKNIVIKETIVPDALTVRAGDEVRWINQRQDSVTVTIDEPLEHNVSCRNGFSKAMGMGVDNSTTLSSNETAGLCFSRIGTVKYSVRPADETKTSMANTHGSITVQ